MELNGNGKVRLNSVIPCRCKRPRSSRNILKNT